MGEVASLHGLIAQLTQAGKHILITTNTHTGYTYITTHFKKATPAFLPLDTPLTLSIALRRVQPTHLIVTEAERWLCLLKLTYRTEKTKVIAYNTYLRSPLNPLKRFWYRQLYQYCHDIYTQECAPFILLDLRATIHQLGSAKASSARIRKESFTPSNTTPLIPVLLVGSVHPDELTVYLRMFTQLTAAHINVHMILVPRHLHWVDSLQAQVNATTQNSFHLNGHEADSRAGTLASVQDHLDIPGISTVSIVGVLYDLYQYATIFYLGATFNKRGGHNVLEPAIWKLPILTGPFISHTNFEARALEQAKGLQRCADAQMLADYTIKLLTVPRLCTDLGIKNAAWINAHAAQKSIL